VVIGLHAELGRGMAMKCLICGNDYKSLGVHIQKKHMNPDEYRIKFNIKLGTPLVDKYISEMLSASTLQRLEDPEYVKQLTEQCNKNKGMRRPVRLPAVSKKHVIDMNKETGENYRKKMIPCILDDYMSGMSYKEIRGKHGVARATIEDWAKLGFIPKRRLHWKFTA